MRPHISRRFWKCVVVGVAAAMAFLQGERQLSAGQVVQSPPPDELGVSAPLPSGIVSWWRGEGSAADAIGTNHGTPQNGATFAPGLVGTAFSFDGIDDVVMIPDAPSLRFPSSSPHTIEAWAFRTGSATPLHLVGRRAGCGFGLDFYQLAIGINAIPSISVPLNVWTHLAITYDGGTLRNYVNGVLVFQFATALSPFPASVPLLIGRSGTCAPFAGLIDEVSLYNRALSQPEIQSIVAAGSEGKLATATPPAPTGLTASVAGTTIVLTWNVAAGATSYRLRAGTAPGASNAFDGNVGNTVSLTAAAPPGTYFVRVHAVYAGGESGPSNEVRLDVGVPGGCNLPSAPTQLTPSVSGVSVTLTWVGAANATSYVIEAGSSSGAANLAAVDTGSTVTAFSATAPPGSYFVRVRARNACGVGPASNEVAILLGGGAVQFAATTQSYPETTPNLDQVCRQEFGPSARLADWRDLVSFVQQGGSISQLANSVGMTQRFNGPTLLARWVSNTGARFTGSRHFFIERHDHIVPAGWLVHATIEANFIDLGSWFGFSTPALCLR